MITLTFDGNFDTGVLTDKWEEIGNSGKATCTAGAAYAGAYGARLTLQPTFPVPDRTEIGPIPWSSYAVLDFGTEYWIGFAMKLVSWAPDSGSPQADSCELVFQTHTTAGKSNCDYGEVGMQPISIVTNDPPGSHNWHIESYHNRSLWSGSYSSDIGQWVRWVIHLRIAQDSSGYIQVWKNGTQVVNDSGQNYSVLDPCGNQMTVPPFIQTGIYKWPWGCGSSYTGSRELYMDSFRIAEGANGYSLVDPAQGGSPPVAAFTGNPTSGYTGPAPI